MSHTALGISTRRMVLAETLSIRLWSSNSKGLAELYNRVIDDPGTPEFVAFVHDDVYLEDYFTSDRVIEGLQHYDIIGLAGGAYRPGQLRWASTRVGSSGAVGHGRQPFGRVSKFGPAPRPVDMLDGLFIAAKTETLRRSGVRFDEAFSFHFYDLDFCLTAKRAGLSLGVWPISATHQSHGNYDSLAWKQASEIFARKWHTEPNATANGA